MNSVFVEAYSLEPGMKVLTVEGVGPGRLMKVESVEGVGTFP